MPTDTKQLRRTIGERIRELRHVRGLSQAKAAQSVSLTVDSWSRIERGAAPNPTLSSYVDIADALGVQVGYLLPATTRGKLAPILHEIVDLVGKVDNETQASLMKAIKGLLEQRSA